MRSSRRFSCAALTCLLVSCFLFACGGGGGGSSGSGGSSGTAPAITAQPASVSVTAPGAAAFTTTATGTPAVAYQWQVSTDGGATFTDVPGANGASYSIPVTATADNGKQFRVVVSNSEGSATSTAATLAVLSPSSSVVQVSAGTAHSLALKSDGTVRAWGSSSNGQLGTGVTGTAVSAPNIVTLAGGSVLSGVASVSAGPAHSLAVKTDGSVFAWGKNSLKALGDGSATDRPNPVAVKDSGGTPFTGVSQVAAGPDLSAALKTAGTVWVWGTYVAGSYGPVGSPTQILETGGSPLSGVTKICLGNGFLLALKSDGTVWSWGYNVSGTLGNGSTATVAFSTVAVQVETAPGVPLGGVVDISGGWTHAIAVASDGRVYSWGTGYLGRTTTVSGGYRAGLVTDAGGTAVTGVIRSNAGENVTMLLKSDGTLLSFGDNVDGKLGGSTNASETWPRTVTDGSGGTFGNVTSASTTSRHTLVVRQDGTVWGWGRNESGQLATAAGPGKINPTRLPGL